MPETYFLVLLFLMYNINWKIQFNLGFYLRVTEILKISAHKYSCMFNDRIFDNERERQGRRISLVRICEDQQPKEFYHS